MPKIEFPDFIYTAKKLNVYKIHSVYIMYKFFLGKNSRNIAFFG